MPKTLMPIGGATETPDTYDAYYPLPEDGYNMVVAGHEARLYHTVLHEIPPNPGKCALDAEQGGATCISYRST